MPTTPNRNPFELLRGIEKRYAIQLRKLAAKVGSVIEDRPEVIDDAQERSAVIHVLNRYADEITPWATRLASRVIVSIDFQNRRAYAAHSANMSRLLRRELQTAPTGQIMGKLQSEQVGLIRSIPIEAAARVQRIAMENMSTGARANELANEIARTTHVTKSRATLIARTETSRSSSNLTQARAQFVGSKEYIWRTAGDSDVRPSHASMAGKTVEWVSPPTLDNMTGHAGCFPNCRCYAEPILPN